MPDADNKPLSERELRFIDYYLIDPSTKDSAIAAGYAAKNAKQAGFLVLQRPRVAREIARRQRERGIRMGFTADHILQELARLAQSDPRQLVDEDGKLIPLRDLPEDIARSIGGIKVTTDAGGNVTYDYKLWDKNAALTNALKHFNQLGTEKIEHSGNIGVEALSAEELAERARRILERQQKS